MKTVGIIQARMTSTRLPGKVLKTVLGKPLLAYEVERLRRVALLDELVVATTTNETDDPVCAFCEDAGVPVYRGSEDDVLRRFYEAAGRFGADTVVRFTADCPLIDPALVSDILRTYLADGARFDYVGVDYESIPRGMDAEVFSYRALERAEREGTGASDREHVTWYLHRNPDRFSVHRYSIQNDWSKYRFTVDTQEDFDLIEKIIENLYAENALCSLADMVHFLESNPQIRQINAEVSQKKYV